MQKCWGGIQIYNKVGVFLLGFFCCLVGVFLQIHSTVQGFWLSQHTFPLAMATAAGGEGWGGGSSTSLWLTVTLAH